MLTSLGVLPNFGFIQGDGDETDKFMPKVVLYYPKKGMTTYDWLVFPGRGGASSEMCKPGVERSSQHVPPQISFLFSHLVFQLEPPLMLNIILYTENPRDATRKLLELINE